MQSPIGPGHLLQEETCRRAKDKKVLHTSGVGGKWFNLGCQIFENPLRLSFSPSPFILITLGENLYRKENEGFPWSSGYDSMVSTQRAWVQSLPRELGSHMPWRRSKIPSAATKTLRGQINWLIFFKRMVWLFTVGLKMTQHGKKTLQTRPSPDMANTPCISLVLTFS